MLANQVILRNRIPSRAALVPGRPREPWLRPAGGGGGKEAGLAGQETYIHWPGPSRCATRPRLLHREVSRARARARGLPASALRMESFLEPLSARPLQADFRPADCRCPAPEGAGNAGIRQSLGVCSKSGWGLRDSKEAPPLRG